jgi:hypothetical protein
LGALLKGEKELLEGDSSKKELVKVKEVSPLEQGFSKWKLLNQQYQKKNYVKGDGALKDETSKNLTWKIKNTKNDMTLEEEKKLTYDNYLYLYNIESKTYLHCHKEGHKDSEIVLQVTSEVKEEDILNFKKIKKEETFNIMFCQSVVQNLLNYLVSLNTNTYVQNDVILLNHSLQELIIFTTDSNEKDALIREGIVHHDRQEMLREFGIIKHTFDIIQLLIEKDITSFENLNDEKNKNYNKAIRLSLKLLKVSCKNNMKNGKEVFSYFNFLFKYINYDYGLNDLIQTILEDNSLVLPNIEKEELNFFLDKFKEYNEIKYIQFLSALCSVGNESVLKNQNFILNKIFINEYDEFKKIILIPYVKHLFLKLLG